MSDRQVRVTLVIDEHGAVRAMRAAGDESTRTEKHLGNLDKSVRGLGKSFGGLKGFIAGGLGALGAGGLVFGLSSIVNKTKEVALETEEFHTQTGIATSSSLYYAHALKARGLTTEQVGKAFGILSKNVKTAELQEHKFGAAQGKATAKGKAFTGSLGRQAEAFKELGIDLASFNNLTEQGKLEQITKHFEAMAPGMKKTRLERELFGRGGNALSIVLEKGNLGLSHQLALVKKYFPTIKDGSHAMEELLEKQTESKLAWEGLQFTLGQKLVPAMTTVMTWMSNLALDIEKGKGPWKDIGGAVTDVVGVFKSVVGWFERTQWATDAVKGSLAPLLGLFVVGKAAEILKVGAAFKALSFATPFMLQVAAVLLLIKGFEKITGDKIMKKLAETTGLIPVERKTYKPGSPVAEGKRKHGEQVYREWMRTHAVVEAEDFHRYGLPAPPAVKHALERPAIAPRLPGGGVFEHAFTIKGDGPLTQAIADAMIHNPRARRSISEAAVIHAQGMTARK